mmetsp:Transcript_73196/g.211813  ORF Transcript_73196/g.211813 Transcript_73196/m.211813 type:complete len:227 (-) Transcript_73196:625-1305(-)
MRRCTSVAADLAGRIDLEVAGHRCRPAPRELLHQTLRRGRRRRVLPRHRVDHGQQGPDDRLPPGRGNGHRHRLDAGCLPRLSARQGLVLVHPPRLRFVAVDSEACRARRGRRRGLGRRKGQRHARGAQPPRRRLEDHHFHLPLLHLHLQFGPGPRAPCLLRYEGLPGQELYEGRVLEAADVPNELAGQGQLVLDVLSLLDALHGADLALHGPVRGRCLVRRRLRRG